MDIKNRAAGEEDLPEHAGQGSQELVPVSRPGGELVADGFELPDIVHRAGQAAVFAADEFFFGKHHINPCSPFDKTGA